MGKYVIARGGQMELVVEKSRFLCTLRRVASEAEAQAFVKEMKKTYWDASHNCSAYIVGRDDRIVRSNDDGEPSGTAGAPMLEVLRRKELYDTAAVVTRYFGGIKLGAGGLTRTYGKCVSQAVDALGLAEEVPMGEYVFPWPVADAGRVMHQLYQQDIFTVGDVEYSVEARLHLLTQEKKREQAEAWLTETLGTTISLEEIRKYKAERPITTGP